MRVKDVAKNLGRRRFPTNADTLTEHPKPLDSNLQREPRRGDTSRRWTADGSAGITHTDGMGGSKLTGSTSQAPFNSNPDDSGPAATELVDQSLHPSQQSIVHEDREADTTGLFGHV